jgi:hypothetical protein
MVLSRLSAMHSRLLLACCLGLSSGLVQADIYKYVDENGVVNYTNMPTRIPARAERIASEPAPSATPAAGAAGAAGGNRPRPAQTATPPGFPRVDGDTQRKRDDSRKQILVGEVQAEQKALEDARQALKDGQEVRQGNERNYQKYLDRVKGLQDEVDTHQANLDALQKEIGNLH